MIYDVFVILRPSSVIKNTEDPKISIKSTETFLSNNSHDRGEKESCADGSKKINDRCSDMFIYKNILSLFTWLNSFFRTINCDFPII